MTMRTLPRIISSVLLLLLTTTTTTTSASPAAAATTSLLDTSTGNLQLGAIPNTVTTSKGVVTIVRSPGTPSTLLEDDNDGTDDILALTSSDSGDVITMICRGATLQGTTETERYSLATCSLVSNAVVLDGVTAGDLEASLRHSRHARTLTALFRARIILFDSNDNEKKENAKQSLILNVVTESDDENDDNNNVEELLEREVLALYEAAAVEKSGAPDFEELYDLQVVTDSSKVMDIATKAASEKAADVSSASSSPLSSALTAAWATIREAGVASVGLDPPHIANAFVTIKHVHAKQTKSARARIAAWKNRIARGLWVDGFGMDATALRQRILNQYDSETLAAAGLPLVASYRLEMRNQLQQVLDSAITDCFEKQVENLQVSTVKRFESQMLKNMSNNNAEKNTYESNEAAMNANAAALRQQTFAFQNVMSDLEVPILNLTKEKAEQSVQTKLNNAMMKFPDSPAAKLKRTKQVSKVVKKDKKPGQRAIGFGLDLVAMLRPDGFGSLQGFAGYSLPGGNSITFGVHNDADDPQVIAQFGGVRPPLLRVQPKLRVDVEL